MTDSSESERFSEGWDEHARKAFALMDPKEGTHILGTQLEYYFQIIGENPTRAEVIAALTAITKTPEDQITFEECVAALKAYVLATAGSKFQLGADEVVRVVGQALDPATSGTFTKDALMKMLGDDGTPSPLERLSRDELEAILSELKITDGKMIQVADFFSLLLDI